jgi:hypothetical protein
MNEENNKPELQLEPIAGELQPVGKMPTLTAEQVTALAVIQSVSKIDVLANAEETAKGIERMKASYLPIVELAKTEIANSKTKADFERSKECRLAIRTERLGFTKTIDAELDARKLVIKSANKGKELVEAAFNSLETELNEAEKPVDEKFKAAAAAKKALADAIAKLNNHVINPLLPSAEIETAIDDFVMLFGDSDYQESQTDAEAIFSIKKSQFDMVLAAAVVREENERKVKEQEKQAEQRDQIKVMFPIEKVLSFVNRSSADIKAESEWLSSGVNMKAFDLVIDDAETAKKSCLSMLNAFLPMAVAREAKEAADKAELNRVDEINAAIKRIADIPSDFIGQKSSIIRQALIDLDNMGNAILAGDFAEFKNEAELTLEDAIERLTVILSGTLKKEYQDDWDLAVEEYAFRESKLIAKLQAKADSDPVYQAAVTKAFVEVDAVKAIEKQQAEIATINTEPCADCNGDVMRCTDGVCAFGVAEDCETLEVFEVANEIVADDCVLIPVKHLKELVFIAQEFENCLDDDGIAALEFAKSLI